MTTTPEPPSLFLSTGSPTASLSSNEVQHHIHSFLSAMGTRSDVLILPPDFTRFHSQAGEITRFICDYYNFVPKEDDCDDEKNLRSVNESFSCPTTQIIPSLGKISLSLSSMVIMVCPIMKHQLCLYSLQTSFSFSKVRNTRAHDTQSNISNVWITTTK